MMLSGMSSLRCNLRGLSKKCQEKLTFLIRMEIIGKNDDVLEAETTISPRIDSDALKRRDPACHVNSSKGLW